VAGSLNDYSPSLSRRASAPTRVSQRRTGDDSTSVGCASSAADGALAVGAVAPAQDSSEIGSPLAGPTVRKNVIAADFSAARFTRSLDRFMRW